MRPRRGYAGVVRRGEGSGPLTFGRGGGSPEGVRLLLVWSSLQGRDHGPHAMRMARLMELPGNARAAYFDGASSASSRITLVITMPDTRPLMVTLSPLESEAAWLSSFFGNWQ